MAPTLISRPQGFYDRTPQETADAALVTARLQQSMTRFGYQLVETPLVEYTDLFLTKAGDEAVNRLFDFELRGRQLCLRSEFTASAARLYIERFQHEPKPIRWQFSGPVFRYESPQRNHSRQFTMLGAELIGPSDITGDAEAIGLAAHGLYALDLRNWKLSIGHVGLITQLLDQFDLDRRMRRFILGHIENLRRPDRGRAYVETQLKELSANLPNWLETLDAEGSAPALQLLLETSNTRSHNGGRTSEDIARRLMTKGRHANQHQQLMKVLDYVEAIIAIEGQPDDAFKALEPLIPNDEAVKQTVQAFRAAIDLLSAYDIPAEQINVQLGLARGLNYYTGIVFEAHTDSGDSATQLFGGGRYDDLLRVLGAIQPTPAIGFAYGLERILHELAQKGPITPLVGVDVLVVVGENSDNAGGVRTALALREHFNAELYTPTSSPISQALARASKQNIPYVAIVGAADQITVRDMQAESQIVCSLSETIQHIKSHLNK